MEVEHHIVHSVVQPGRQVTPLANRLVIKLTGKGSKVQSRVSVMMVRTKVPWESTP